MYALASSKNTIVRNTYLHMPIHNVPNKMFAQHDTSASEPASPRCIMCVFDFSVVLTSSLVWSVAFVQIFALLIAEETYALYL